jgi:hypothetical protein
VHNVFHCNFEEENGNYSIIFYCQYHAVVLSGVYTYMLATWMVAGGSTIRFRRIDRFEREHRSSGSSYRRQQQIDDERGETDLLPEVLQQIRGKHVIGSMV